MTERQRAGCWARGAWGVVLAYAWLLQVLVAGLGADRTVFAAIGTDTPTLCTASGSAAFQLPATSGPGQPDGDPSACRDLCILSSPSPLVPIAAMASLLVVTPGAARHASGPAPTDPGLRRHEPRTSQGPPLTA